MTHAQPKDVEDTLVVTVKDGLATMRYNRPSKLNSMNQAQHKKIWNTFDSLSKDPAVNALVITGTGRFFSAGADFGESQPLSLMLRPSAWRSDVANVNVKIFAPYITFPKPIVAAVNGPAIGMGVTTVSLCDYVVCTPTASFCTPFAKLKVPCEGCSSINFERRFGADNAAALLERGETIDAHTAKEYGLVSEIVEADELMKRASEVARKLIQEGKARPLVQDGLVETFLEVNKQESIELANTVISPEFFQNQMKAAAEKGQSSMAWAFWFMSKLVATLDSFEAIRGAKQPLRIQSRL